MCFRKKLPVRPDEGNNMRNDIVLSAALFLSVKNTSDNSLSVKGFEVISSCGAESFKWTVMYACVCVGRFVSV